MALKEQLINYFSSFVTERRLELFNDVLNGRTNHVRMILENVKDPGDASAVMRSCECFGIQHLDLICNYPFKPNKGIMVGAAKWIDFKAHGRRGSAPSLLELCGNLSEKGYRHVVFCKDPNTTSIHDLDLSRPLTIIQSGNGEPSQEALEMADELVHIPTQGVTSDFNVSIRAALMLSVVARRLRESHIEWHLQAEDRSELELTWLLKMIEMPDLYLKRFLSDHKIGSAEALAEIPALSAVLK